MSGLGDDRHIRLMSESSHPEHGFMRAFQPSPQVTNQRTYFGDPGEVSVGVDDSEVVMKCGLGNQEIGDGNPVPQPVMVG